MIGRSCGDLGNKIEKHAKVPQTLFATAAVGQRAEIWENSHCPCTWVKLMEVLHVRDFG